MAKVKKYRKFEIVSRDPHEVLRLLELVKNYYKGGRIHDYAYATHDKDVYTRGVDDPDEIPVGKTWGDLKDKHTHIGFVWYTTASFQTIANKFGVLVNSVEQIKSPRFADYLAYLTHKNAPGKHQYDDSIVHTSIVDWQDQRDALLDAKKLKSMEAMYPHYLSLATKGELKRKDIGDKLPAEIYATHKSSLDTAFEKASEIEAKMMGATNSVNKTIMFISGNSGCGKTTYAKVMAIKRGMDYFQSGSGNDLLDGYQGEDCLILDDVRGHNFEYEDLLKLIDPNNISKYKSRYSNKLITSKLVILTSIQSLEDFINDIPNHKKEDDYQVKRRIAMYLNMDNQKIHVFKFNKSVQGYYQDLGIRDNQVQKYVSEHKGESIRPEEYLW